ncbi:MAG TPA: divalent metal cation transporter, partial [Candidatus Tumulicola sp.]|nr:divalent metal cation transporter [Candidatus Tumulicola sp.]
METEPRSRLRPPVGAAAPAHRPVPIFGPGLVAGASANDPTTVASLAVVGSATAYGLAWLVVLLLPMLALVQTIAANVATVTHASLQQTIVRTYGRPVATVAFGLVAAVGFVTLAADL